MAGNANNTISGSAMAVLIGAGAILASIFVQNLGLGDRLILFFLGLFFSWAGLRFSRG